MTLEIIESDEAGKVVARFVHTSSSTGSERFTFIVWSRDPNQHNIKLTFGKPPESPKGAWQQLLDVFLPAGYPHSVTEDYMPYVKLSSDWTQTLMFLMANSGTKYMYVFSTLSSRGAGRLTVTLGFFAGILQLDS